MSVRIRPAGPAETGVLFAIDDDASRLFAPAGVVFDFAEDHPFVLAEHGRWTAAAARGSAFVAEVDGVAVGMMVLGVVDDAPYLDQLAVRMGAMRRGVGQALLQEAIARAGPAGLWLNTYDHLAWNRPYYARAGFAVVPEAAWGPQMRALVAEQRAYLPAPDQRVVMFRPRL